MALADLLGMLNGANPIGFNPPRPAYGGYQFDIPQAPQQAAPQGMPQAQPAMPAPHGPSKFRNFLGAIGDALMVGGGGQPLYRQHAEQQRAQSALQGFLTNPDQAIAQLMQVDAPSAISLYKAVHPASETPSIIAELKAAGIDPASDEGKAIIRQHAVGSSGGADPSIIRVLGALGIDPHSDEGRRLVYGSVSPPGYLMTPPAGGATSGGSEGLPHVSTPEEAHQLPPGSRFLMPDGRIGTVPGGATASPSPTFPVTVRNNNPGALRVPGSMRFQSFNSPQEGVRAQEAQLGRYFNRGLNSVSRIVETYAPRKSRGGDNTDAQVNNYIGYVSRRLGIHPSAPIAPANLSRLAQAMREFETGKRVD